MMMGPETVKTLRLQELVDNPDETDDVLRLGQHRLRSQSSRCSAASHPPSRLSASSN